MTQRMTLTRAFEEWSQGYLESRFDFGEEGTLHARLNVAMRQSSALEEVGQRIVTTLLHFENPASLGEKYP